MAVRKYRATIEDKMESEAEFGFDYAYLKITKKKGIELENQGFVVTDSHNSRSYPRLHKISWKDSAIEYDELSSLNEKDSKYTFAQKLWIIAEKNKPKK